MNQAQTRQRDQMIDIVKYKFIILNIGKLVLFVDFKRVYVIFFT